VNTSDRSALRDGELVEMLALEPELLAIADALVQTRPSTRRLPLPRSRAVAASTVAAVLVAAAVALLLVSPWQGSGGLVDRALAAVGDQEVLHVLIERPARDRSLVDIRTGATIPRHYRTEIWFDAERELKKTVGTVDGTLLDETLETAEGGWTQGGPIYTCAWIAAHPAEATKARVSCNPSMENGTTPRKIPEQPPTLEQALAGFLDRYQSALASGRATQIGTGDLDGRQVVWLRIQAPSAEPRPEASPSPPTTQEVAIDADTYRPVLVRLSNGDTAFRVLAAETVPYQPGLFTRPDSVESQGGGNVSPGVVVTTEQATAILGGKLLWLGRDWQGMRLLEATHHRPTVTYWLAGSRERHERADVIGLTYAPVGDDGTVDEHSRLTIYEAAECVVNVGMMCTPDGPSEGQMLLRPPIASFLRLDGLYVTLWDSYMRAQPQTLLDMARALHSYAG
jgi:hypothetical protein